MNFLSTQVQFVYDQFDSFTVLKKIAAYLSLSLGPIGGFCQAGLKYLQNPWAYE